ncbi:amidophosphoribosyltransferase [Pyrobaculum islandicum DSM 4184]|uniref:Amidophosphoribosyltransferase n=1 Tax=Pyrobaculum islandicum (strain DSM 4184 / JCM 9189 / GEO3) TaxID=384616 RepID=A1RQQ3_PYRIL|nr:amidophosphoribosyltransferase [Pyrobaculum islandicum]ABL87285.1 amidophosphoribosyltransferase [Pyrobaculum islandicum DSM 4184]
MCGIGAAWGKGAGAAVVKIGLWLSHRGHEGVGYAYLENGAVKLGKPPEDTQAALVHVRYSTSGPYGVSLQPVYVKYRDLEIAVAFNGTIVNFRQLDNTASFDGEALAKSLAREMWERGVVEGVQEVYKRIVGAASLVALTPWGILAVRDPHGIRPLALSHDIDGVKIASETVALENGIELAPGIAIMYGDRISTWKIDPKPMRLCALEYVYFAHPASKLGGRLVADVRKALGRALAEDETEEGDVVTYVPETARHAALGFAKRLGLEVVDAVVKNRFSGRLFIRPPSERKPEEAFYVVRDFIEKKRVFLIDDSLIRGTNIKAIIWMLKKAGATKVHVRIASPPIRWPCFYGMDFQKRTELVAWGRDVEEVREIIGADTLRYISMEKFRAILGDVVCYSCFTGVYPHGIDIDWAERELSRNFK